MNKILLLFSGIWAVGALSAQVSPYNPDPNPPAVLPGYKLVWSDEFNEPGKPSTANWSYETGFVRNEEHQWYQSDNATVEGGSLRITGRRQTFRNPNYEAGSSDWKKNREFVNYTSSSIHSRGKRSFKYGRFEIRAKIPAVTGAWPAIWTLGDWGEWPTNGEIDIMEYYGDGILANAAWGSTTRWQGVWDSSKKPMSHFYGKDSDWANKYHIWVMDWTPEFIKIYLDGELLNTIETAKTVNADGSNPFTSRNHYVLLNLALGGNNGGDPSRPNYPITYFVDYVRVYQPDPSYSMGFVPLQTTGNLAPDPDCNSSTPDGEGDRVRNRNPLKVYSGAFSGEIKGGIYAQRIVWTPGKSYRVRAMVNAKGDDVVLGVNGLGDKADVEHLIGYQPGEWQQVDFVFTAPESAGAGGGVYLKGSSGSLIDNVEVYENPSPFLQVTRRMLNFAPNIKERVVGITAHGMSGNILLTAPSGITLDRQVISADEARRGAYVKATYSAATAVSGTTIKVLSNLGTQDIIVYADPAREIGTNLLGSWDAKGATGAGSEPDKAGWLVNGTVVWRQANATTDVRFTDHSTSGSYTFNGLPWAGRLLHVRWDSGLTPEKYYSYPVDLYKGKYYTFKGLYGWQANGSEYSIYSIGLNTARDNTGTSVLSHHKTILRADRLKLFDLLQVFTVPEDGRYFFTVTNTAAIMGAVGALELREGIHLPAELSALPLTLTFSESNKSRQVAIYGKFIHDDIELVAPQGFSFSRSTVSTDEINSGVVLVNVFFDGSRTVENEQIEFISGTMKRTIAVSASQYATSIHNVTGEQPELNAYFADNQLIASLRATTSESVSFKLFTLQGVLLHSAQVYPVSSVYHFQPDVVLAAGQYLIVATGTQGRQVRKIVRF